MALHMKRQDATALANAIAKGVLTAREAMDAAVEAAENGALWAPLHISIQNLATAMQQLLMQVLTKYPLLVCHRCSGSGRTLRWSANPPWLTRLCRCAARP